MIWDSNIVYCYACNGFLMGNGYCAEHSTGGTAYFTKEPQSIQREIAPKKTKKVLSTKEE